jgi:hypothetical protein
MPIVFHCENCKKKINAPDDAGGKWGKCPYCNHRCYIPSLPSGEEEELKLSPVDETAEEQYQRMMKETHNITESLLHETEGPPDDSPAKNSNDKDLTAQIIGYLRLMADGSLDEANIAAKKIISQKAAAKTIFENLLKAPRPVPQLQDIPKKVLEGFIRNILTKM